MQMNLQDYNMKLLDIFKKSNTLNEGVYDPSIFKAFFLAGGPGSGKTFVTGKVTSGHGLRFINSDTFFEKLLRDAELSMDLEYLKYEKPDEYEKAMQLRDKAKLSAKKAESNYLVGRLGVIYDGTGDDYAKIKNLRQKCIELGYDTYMIFVNTSLDVALQRNAQRERSVAKDVVTDSWKSVQNNMGKFQNLFGTSNFIVVDNNTFNEDLLNKVWKRVTSMIKAPIKNPIAKQWIDAQLQMKKRT